MKEDFITLKEAKRITGKSYSTIFRLIQNTLESENEGVQKMIRVDYPFGEVKKGKKYYINKEFLLRAVQGYSRNGEVKEEGGEVKMREKIIKLETNLQNRDRAILEMQQEIKEEKKRVFEERKIGEEKVEEKDKEIKQTYLEVGKLMGKTKGLEDQIKLLTTPKKKWWQR